MIKVRCEVIVYRAFGPDGAEVKNPPPVVVESWEPAIIMLRIDGRSIEVCASDLARAAGKCDGR